THECTRIHTLRHTNTLINSHKNAHTYCRSCLYLSLSHTRLHTHEPTTGQVESYHNCRNTQAVKQVSVSQHIQISFICLSLSLSLSLSLPFSLSLSPSLSPSLSL